jgi:hypothetical protein
MKKLLLFAAFALTLTSCAEDKVIDGKVYRPYGWMDADEYKSDKVAYRVNKGNVVLDIIFSETLVVPVLLTGTQFYEPFAIRDNVNVDSTAASKSN